MPLTFRYRYVDIGTVFTGDPGRRAPEADANSPSTLFANEIACDVGGTCWGANEPLPILDHHFLQHAQFPSSCAAVLHKSALIHSKFAHFDDVIWLVTHKDPDFDAFCSMYLVRRMIENDAPNEGWESYGLNSEGWFDTTAARKIDWLNPELGGIAGERRWPLLLAGYASLLEARRHISCPLQRQLRSVLYAARKRGRDYLNHTSGATEFFDEVRSVLREKQLNPIFDSVLEGSVNFAPELAMLDREVDLYQRDLERSRKALVYLPEAEAPSPDFFEHSKRATTPEISAESLLLADSFRIATDGIYLRDPECTLFQEWARVDLDNSSLGAGFEFTAIADPHGIPDAPMNSTEYVFSIDPERANGRHLYTVWSRLETEELNALRRTQESMAEVASRPAGDARVGTIESLLSDPWLGGDRRSSTLVVAPRHGTRIGQPGSRSDLRDDPVIEAVRTELEGPIYTAASLVSGPQVTIHDFAASQGVRDALPRHFEFNAPLKLQPPEDGFFRYARIGLRADVPIAGADAPGRALERQIGESLWQFLYPEKSGETPQDFGSHLLATADSIGVWSDRGIAIAGKHSKTEQEISGLASADDDLQDFAILVSLVRDVDRLTSEWESVGKKNPSQIEVSSRTTAAVSVQRLAECEQLARRALELQHTLALPERQLLRHFSEAIGFEQLVTRLHELNQIAANQQYAMAADEGRKSGSVPGDLTRVRQQLRWLEVFVIAFVALEVVAILLRSGILGSGSQQVFTWFGGPLAFACAAWFLQPWRIKQGGRDRTGSFKWLVVVALLVWTVAWLTEIFR